MHSPSREFEVKMFGSSYHIRLEFPGFYQDGSMVIRAVCLDGTPFATLTVHIPGTKLEEEEVLVKTWSENEALAEAVLREGFFRDTGKRIPTGFVKAAIYKVNF